MFATHSRICWLQKYNADIRVDGDSAKSPIDYISWRAPQLPWSFMFISRFLYLSQFLSISHSVVLHLSPLASLPSIIPKYIWNIFTFFSSLRFFLLLVLGTLLSPSHPNSELHGTLVESLAFGWEDRQEMAGITFNTLSMSSSSSLKIPWLLF